MFDSLRALCGQQKVAHFFRRNSSAHLLPHWPYTEIELYYFHHTRRVWQHLVRELVTIGKVGSWLDESGKEEGI